MSFEQLKNKYRIQNNTIFCYYQIKAYLRDKLGPAMLLPKRTEMEILISNRSIKKCISVIYTLFQKGTQKQGIHRSRQRWEIDLNIIIDGKKLVETMS